MVYLGVPWSWQQQAEPELHRHYGWSLAIDLKRELGEDYYVEYGGREIHDDHAFMKQLKDLR